MPDPTPVSEPAVVDVGAAVQTGTLPDVTPAPIASVPASSLMDLDPGESASDVLGRDRDKLERSLNRQDVTAPKRRGNPDQPKDEKSGRFIEGTPKKTAPKPVAKPAPAAPAASGTQPKPVAKPAPAAQPKPDAPAAPAASATPAKVKVGGKEYTVEELEKLLAKQDSPAASPAPAAAPTPAQPSGPTPEQIKEAESKFINDLVPKIDVELSDKDLETVLVGGAEGAAVLTNALKRAAARAVVEARRSLADDFNPHLQEIYSRLAPIVSEAEALQRITVEQAFLQTYPEYSEYIADAREVAEALLKAYPEQVRGMTREQFLTIVEQQTDRLKQAEFARWNPQYKGSWKQWVKEKNTPVPAAPEPAPAPDPTPEPAPAPVEKPKIAAPAANPPGVVVGGKPKSWHKSTAASLTE